jgi:hypothetical protein
MFLVLRWQRKSPRYLSCLQPPCNSCAARLLSRKACGAVRQDGAYSRGIKDFLDFTDIFVTTAQGGEKTVIGRFLAAAQKFS